jgi:hypothetical protein
MLDVRDRLGHRVRRRFEDCVNLKAGHVSAFVVKALDRATANSIGAYLLEADLHLADLALEENRMTSDGRKIANSLEHVRRGCLYASVLDLRF